MPCQYAGEEMAVEPVHIVDRMANVELRMQVEQQMNIAERAGEIKQGDSFSREGGKLHAEIDRNGGSADAALRAHHDDKAVHGGVVFDVQVLHEPRQNFFYG